MKDRDRNRFMYLSFEVDDVDYIAYWYFYGKSTLCNIVRSGEGYEVPVACGIALKNPADEYDAYVAARESAKKACLVGVPGYRSTTSKRARKLLPKLKEAIWVFFGRPDVNNARVAKNLVEEAVVVEEVDVVGEVA